VELVWNGKSSEVGNIVRPVQVIEQVDEWRAEKPAQSALFDARAQFKGGLTNSSGRWKRKNNRRPTRGAEVLHGPFGIPR